jgi:decaprenylphospho-beta-D-ribofuranose 2-oxidase
MSNPEPANERVLKSVPAGPDAARDRRETDLSGWGQHPVVRGVELLSENLREITVGATLSRGLGRAYGDAALPPANSRMHVAGTPLADRLLAFDPETGVLRAEAGLSLAALNETFLPRGFTTPVSPGTGFVTLGGMVASDVHGKNHHVAGCFGEHVRALLIRVADGRILEVSEEHEPELFRATLGGMGLTGHILEVEVQLARVPSPWIWYESERLPNLDQVVQALSDAGKSWPSTVGWIDCTSRGHKLGRGIVMRGRWATAAEAPVSHPPKPPNLMIPWRFPSGLANRHTLRIMNAFWYRWHGAGKQHGLGTPTWWFHPLDGIAHWHRVFGARGFTQYQAVIPGGVDVFREFLEVFQRGGGSSFVTVLKDCGAEGRGTLSWPKPGSSLALDLPIQREKTEALVQRLNEFVIAAGGRVYLAKDAFTRPDDFRAMYPRFEEWNAVRRRFDPEGLLGSAQSERLEIR